MSRRFYRLVSEMEPPLDDFRSQADQGRVYDDEEVQRRAEEISVWGHYGIPKEFSAEEIRRWIVDVVALPSSVESPR